MTKPTMRLCAQRRLRSAWASAQYDLSSLCAQWVAKDPSFVHAESEDSDQTVRMPHCWFCHEAAQIFLSFSNSQQISTQYSKTWQWLQHNIHPVQIQTSLCICTV